MTKTRRRYQDIGDRSIFQIQNFECGKIPPQAVDLEERVIGIVLEWPEVYHKVSFLKPEFFYKESHQHIWKAIKELGDNNDPPEIMVVIQKLRSQGKLDDVGGAYAINQLSVAKSSSAGLEYNARIIHQKAIQRSLIELSSRVIRKGYDDTTDIFELLDQFNLDFLTITSSLQEGYIENTEEIIDNFKKQQQAIKDNDGVIGLKTLLNKLDQYLLGFVAPDMIVLAGRPGMGKTALALTICHNIAVKQNLPVAFFTLEMSSLQLMTRLISIDSEVPAFKIRSAQYDGDEEMRVNRAAERIAKAPFYINDKSGLQVSELRSIMWTMVNQYGIRLAVIDYIQLMSYEQKGINREQEISFISRNIKATCKDLNIPILALSQLSRSVETRGGDKRPKLSDLRESGSIEQDADEVLLIYRPSYYKIYVNEDGTNVPGDLTEIDIAKNRHGESKKVAIRWISKFTRFENWDEEVEFEDVGFVELDETPF